MVISNWWKSPWTKALLAVVALGGLAVTAGSSLAPQSSPWQVLAVVAVGGAVLLGLVVAVLIATLTVRQFILRLGGTDVQWFWFSAEPPGLVQLRQQARERGGDTDAH